MKQLPVTLAAIAIAIHAGAGFSRAEEIRRPASDFVGKMPVAVFAPGLPELPANNIPWKLDSSVGKPPAPLVLEGPPPRTKGIGLRFDTEHIFYVYTDANAGPNHYAPSGWMGDYGDLSLDVNNRQDPADGSSSLKITYRAKGSQGFHWAGMYWQEPANNWGNLPGGFNLAGSKFATF
jgi:hypothetical protein